MTMTVKLEAPLERALRERAAGLGRSASALIREALQHYLARPQPDAPSAYALGQGYFGKHAGPPELARQRKAELLSVWEQKRPAVAAKRGKAAR